MSDAVTRVSVEIEGDEISFETGKLAKQASGAVVVQASVKADGSTGDVTVLRDLPGGFAAMAIEAAKQWRFQSALRDGQGVPSKVAIAFVYSSRALNPF